MNSSWRMTGQFTHSHFRVIRPDARLNRMIPNERQA
jgi:hypothetical protein